MIEAVMLRVKLAETKPYLDILDVSLLSGYSLSTIRRRIDEGQLKALQNIPKGKLLFKRVDIESWLENGARWLR